MPITLFLLLFLTSSSEPRSSSKSRTAEGITCVRCQLPQPPSSQLNGYGNKTTLLAAYSNRLQTERRSTLKGFKALRLQSAFA